MDNITKALQDLANAIENQTAVQKRKDYDNVETKAEQGKPERR